MVRKLALAVSLALGSLPLSVYAIGLGDIKTRSALNQNFKGEIQLLSVPRGELDTIRVKLASREAFAKVGSEYLHILNQLKFEPVRRKNGSAVILVTTSNVIREPFLDFLVEVNWPNGRLVREYTVLLDPPLTTRRRPAEISKPRVSNKKRAAPATSVRERPATTEPRSKTPPITSDAYGPVAANETAWEIAAELKPQGISIHQMMMALLHANPHAFVNNNVNLLKRDAMLRVPGVDEVKTLNRQEAIASFKQQTDEWKEKSSRAADLPVSAEASADLSTVEPLPARVDEYARLQIATASTEAEGAAGVSETEAASQAANEDIKHELMLAREKAETLRLETDDLKEKFNDMASQLEDMKHLLTLQNEELARLRSSVSTKTDEPVASAEPQQDAPLTEAPGKTEGAIDQEQEITEAAAISDSEPVAEPIEDTAAASAKPEAITAAEKPVETVADSGKQTSWLENNLTMIAGAAAGLFGMGVLIALVRGRQKKQALAEDTGAADEETIPRVYDDKTGTGGQPEVDLEKSYLSEHSAKNIQASEDDAVEVDPLAAADVYIAYDRYEQAQKILEDEIVRGDKSVPIRRKLLEVYFATQDSQGFAKIAGEMVQDGQHKEDTKAWEHIRDMGKKLDKFNPLFWATDSATASVEKSALSMDLGNETNELDSSLDKEAESLGEMEDLQLDFSSLDTFGSDEISGAGDIEIEEDDLGKTLVETELEDLSDLDGITQTEIEESAGGNDEDIKFAEPVHDIEIGDEVDTKIELARAYMDMGDHKGALSILKEVLDEGTDDQISSALELISRLNS